MKLTAGDFIASVPMHANGLLTHKDVEFGFVSSVNKTTGVVFCRYFRRDVRLENVNFKSGAEIVKNLRTLANTEATSQEFIVKIDGVLDKSIVFSAMDILGKADALIELIRTT